MELSQLEVPSGICVTAQISGHARKLDAIFALVRLDPKESGKLDKLNKLAVTARPNDAIVHDPWIARDGKLFRLETTARKVLKAGSVPTDTADTIRLVEEIRKLIDNYSELMKVHLPDWHASPEAPGGA